MANNSAGASSRSPHQQEGLAVKDSCMAIALQHSHATIAHDWSVAEAALSHSVAGPVSTAARDEVTSASSAALSVDRRPHEPLPASRVGPLMVDAASALGPAEATGCADGESASGHPVADSSSLDTAADLVIKPHSAATAGSAAKTHKSWPAGSSLGQTDMLSTEALVQVDMPLTKALVQSSGTGCEDVLEMSEEHWAVGRVRQRESWVSRSFRGKVHSSCTLQLLSKTQHGVSIKVNTWFDSLVAFVASSCTVLWVDG